jgi:hypothetical protein
VTPAVLIQRTRQVLLELGVSQNVVWMETDVALGECEAENTYTYNANGTYSYIIYSVVEGSVSCLDNPFEERTGSWTKNFDGTFKFTDSNNEESNYDLKFVSNSEFYFEYTELSSGADPTLVTVRETYIKQ